MSILFIFCLVILITVTEPQEYILPALPPKITWINIGSEILPPTITISFTSTIDPARKLVDFWLRLELPFIVNTLGPPLWAGVETCCDFANTPLLPTKEIITKTGDTTSEAFIQFLGGEYRKELTYILQLSPDAYLKQEGFSEALRLSIVSAPALNFITFGYNYAFMSFYGAEVPSNSLIMQDDTSDPLKSKVNQQIDSYLIVTFPTSLAQRVVIQTMGDYKFVDDADTSCSLVSDSSRGIVAPKTGDVQCGFWEDLGPKKRNFIVFYWNNYPIPAGEIKFKFRLKTPAVAGGHKLNIMTMAKNSAFIYYQKQYFDIFSADNDVWGEGYPQLFYSFNLNANNDKIPDQIGLYSSSLGFNKIYNSLRFVVKADAAINPLITGESHILEIYIGTEDAQLPIGYIYDDIPVAAEKKKKSYSFSGGKLTIGNIALITQVEYSISIKVAFTKEGALPTDLTRGFGLCILKLRDTILFKSLANIRPRFNVVMYNSHLLTVESVERNDVFKRKHKGYSAFRSADPSGLYTASEFQINSGRNGLRFGDNQYFWMQSSIGPNFLFYNIELSDNHDSNRTFLDIYTDPNSIVASPAASWTDPNVNDNCAIYSSVYDAWTDNFGVAKAQAVVGTTITINPTPPLTQINLLGGCRAEKINIGADTLTRLRMRLQDKYYVDTNVLGRFVRSVQVSFIKELNSDAGINGNYFVWKRIDIKKRNSFKWIDTDAAIQDAFVNLYLFSGVSTTTDNVLYPPEISAMDNLYVLSDTTNSFPLSIAFSAHHMWMQDSEVLATKWNIESNPISSWPNVLHIAGAFGTQDTKVKSIIIFFDFLEPLLADEFDEIDCSVVGIISTGCTIGYGNNEVDEGIFKNVQGNGGFLYTVSRYTHFLKVDVDASTVVDTQYFSIAFPFRLFQSDNMNKLINAYENFVPLNPSFVSIDGNWSIIEAVDFGVNSANYPLNIFHDDYVLSDILSEEIYSSEVRKLDDAIADNNPSDAVWFEKATDELIVGEKIALTQKSTCASCDDFTTNSNKFGASLICGNWDFGMEKTFSVDNQAPDDRTKCHKISYLDPYTNEHRYCLHCPGLVTISTPSIDASALTFQIVDFRIPNYFGLKWPSDMIAVVSEGRVIKR